MMDDRSPGVPCVLSYQRPASSSAFLDLPEYICTLLYFFPVTLQALIRGFMVMFSDSLYIDRLIPRSPDLGPAPTPNPTATPNPPPTPPPTPTSTPATLTHSLTPSLPHSARHTNLLFSHCIWHIYHPSLIPESSLFIHQHIHLVSRSATVYPLVFLYSVLAFWLSSSFLSFFLPSSRGARWAS